MEQMFDPRDLAQELSLGLPSAPSCTLGGVSLSDGAWRPPSSNFRQLKVTGA